MTCEMLYSKIVFGKGHYEGGKKYCRRCEIYFSYDGVFCPCCGMALRMQPTNKRDKERLRQLQLRREEQDRIIRIIKGEGSNLSIDTSQNKVNISQLFHNRRSPHQRPYIDSHPKICQQVFISIADRNSFLLAK